MKPEAGIRAGCFTLILLVSCSSNPTLQERYDKMGPEAQAAFLAYYPRLKPMEREAMAEHANEYLRKWKIEQEEIRSKIEKIPSYADQPKSYTLTGLDVIPSVKNPIVSGTDLEMRAILRYADGRTADATLDVEWRAYPSLARLEDGKLRYDCVASDVVLAANFLRERQGAVTLQFRKPLASLDLDLAGSSKGLSRTGDFQLELTARCQDGTLSDVACQAEWKSDTPGVEIHGCGYVRIQDPAKVRDGTFRVTAAYGGLRKARTLHAPLAR